MKFEKFLKSVGTHGQIYTRDNGDRWLICGGVGMVIPAGVDNLLGSGEVSDKIKKVVEALITANVDDKVELIKAKISADGKASDIIRIFGAPLDNDIPEVGISNANFGLLEKQDVNIAEVEIENEDEFFDEKYLIILDFNDNVIGFIKEIN